MKLALLLPPHSVGGSKSHGHASHVTAALQGEDWGQQCNLYGSHQLRVLGFCSWAGEVGDPLREDPGELPCMLGFSEGNCQGHSGWDLCGEREQQEKETQQRSCCVGISHLGVVVYRRLEGSFDSIQVFWLMSQCLDII